MEIRVIDFEVLTRNFKAYIEGHNNIQSEKRKMLESVDLEKKEFESIIKRSQSGILMDEASQKRDAERFRQIQESLMKADMDFKKKLKEMSDDLNTSVYDQLSVIINDWAKDNSVDLVMGKMEVVYNREQIDVTNHIIEILKQKGLHHQEEVTLEQDGPSI